MFSLSAVTWTQILNLPSPPSSFLQHCHLLCVGSGRSSTFASGQSSCVSPTAPGTSETCYAQGSLTQVDRRGIGGMASGETQTKNINQEESSTQKEGGSTQKEGDQGQS